MKFSRMIRRWPASFLLKKPFTCNLKVTQRCNLKCSFCGLWQLADRREMSLPELQRTADLLNDAGLARVVITGGEPFLRPDLHEIVSIFTRRGFSTTLLTNGYLASHEDYRKLYNSGLNDIGISLDSLSPDRQAAVCGAPDVWDRAVRSIHHCVEIFQRGIVEVLVTVTGENLHEIPDLIRFIHEDLGAWSVLNPVNINPQEYSILSRSAADGTPPLNPDLVDDVYGAIRQLKRSGYRILVSDAFLDVSSHYLKTGDLHWDCDAGDRYFTIFSDGGLAPCSDLPVVANVLEMNAGDFRSASFRSACASLRHQCPGCVFSCWREASYLFSRPSTWIERFRHLIHSRTGASPETSA